MATYTPQPSNPPTHKHSLHYILSPVSHAATAPDVPRTSPMMNHRTAASSPPSQPTTRGMSALPADVLAKIAYHVLVGPDGNAGRPSLLIPLLRTSRALNAALKFDNNPVLYNRLFRATFDVSALVRRTQWMFDLNAYVPGTPRTNELFANPRSWALEYRDRWELRNRMRACIAHQSVNVPGVSSRETLDNDMWSLWFLWAENDSKNLAFLTDECWFHQFTLCYYKDNMLKDSLKSGYPSDSAEKALGIWTALLSGSDLFGERTQQEIDDKIFMLRPYVFAPRYNMTYANWEHRKLPLCDHGCSDHPPITRSVGAYRRFGHKHTRAPPHFALAAMLLFIRLLERQPSRCGLKPASTSFLGDVRRGLFSITHIMPSLYHDIEWQRNTVCQDPHTSPGLPPLTFLGGIQGFWRGHLLFLDFEAYREMLAGNMRAVYTGTFARHAVELDLKETVIRVRHEDVGGKGSRLNAGFGEEDTDEEQNRILDGYGHEVVTGDAIYARDAPGWTKEILLSGGCRSSWGWSHARGRIRAWDGLITIAIGHSKPHSCGQWIWRGYIHTGGYMIGRWRDCFASEDQPGYEGPLALIRAGDLFYPSHFPTSIHTSGGLSKLDFGPGHTVPVPGGHRPTHRQTSTPTSGHSNHGAANHSATPSAGPIRTGRRGYSAHSQNSNHSAHSGYSNHSGHSSHSGHSGHSNHSAHSNYSAHSSHSLHSTDSVQSSYSRHSDPVHHSSRYSPFSRGGSRHGSRGGTPMALGGVDGLQRGELPRLRTATSERDGDGGNDRRVYYRRGSDDIYKGR